MPEPTPHPHAKQIRKVAQRALVLGLLIMGAKFAVFAITNSAAVLSDAMESIINVVAAGFMLYSLWLSDRPPDPDHPYGHGKVEFMAIGLEGWLILLAGVVIAYEAVRRFIFKPPIENLELGLWLLAGVGVASGGLGLYVWHQGRKYQSEVLIADGKHLLTDVASTTGVLIGLMLAWWTEQYWLDPLVALLMAGLILFTSWNLLWKSVDGLMDRSDPADDAAIRAILDDEVRSGQIHGYHKVRHRHQGPFHWVDMHLQVDEHLSVRESHELASRIEKRIEDQLGQANATAHVEPSDPRQAD